MKYLKLDLFKDGSVKIVENTLLFYTENISAQLIVDFSNVDVEGLPKWVDFDIADGTTATVPRFGDAIQTGNILTITLDDGLLKQGRLTLQPYAYDADTNVKMIFSKVRVVVGGFLNVVNDTSFTDENPLQTILDDLQDQIDAIDHTGVPDGGFTNQYLVKIDATDYNTEWRTIDSTEVAYGDGNVSEGLENRYTETEVDLLLGNKVTVVAGSSLVDDIQIASTTIPRWDDLFFPLSQSKLGANLKPDFDFTNNGLLFPRNDTSEYVLFTVQMPHSWLVGSAIYPHLHYIQNANTQPVFTLQYRWTNIGAVESGTWTTITLNTNTQTYTSGNLHQVLKGTSIDGTGKTISSILDIKLYRNDNVYVGDLLAKQFDIHYQVDSFGSRQEYVK